MFVATLIADPSGPGIDLARLDAIAARFDVPAGRADWLSPGTAVDLGLDAKPSEAVRHEVALLAGEAQIDCVVQQAAGRRKRVLLADMDSTMIGQECIDELAAEIGIKDRVATITARAMNGEIAFEPALRERVALLQGLAENVVDKVIADRITLSPGGKCLVATMRANGGYCALVSGGFTVFTGRIAAMLGFDENRANRLLIADGRFTGKVAEPILGSSAKVEALHAITAERQVSPKDAIAVGDGANDLPMLLEAGTGVALHAKPAVARQAPHRVDHGDLTALLYIQGYRDSEFMR